MDVNVLFAVAPQFENKPVPGSLWYTLTRDGYTKSLTSKETAVSLDVPYTTAFSIFSVPKVRNSSAIKININPLSPYQCKFAPPKISRFQDFQKLVFKFYPKIYVVSVIYFSNAWNLKIQHVLN